ncbi:hypothetical protein PTKIN_Ptkin03bG0223900 [Pterospermum kingtungense]
MAVRSGGSSTVKSPPPPCPKSPPEYPDLYGKRREMAKVQMMEREISFLEVELKSAEALQPASKCCKEVTDFVMANSDPLTPRRRKNRKSSRFWKWLWYQFLLTFVNFLEFLALTCHGSAVVVVVVPGALSISNAHGAVSVITCVIATYAPAAHAFAAYVTAGPAITVHPSAVHVNAAHATAVHASAAHATAVHASAAHATAVHANAAHANAAHATAVHANAAPVTAVGVNAIHVTAIHV